MAKSKNYNPADAFRKAQRAKELKKNKEDRKKIRDSKAIKSDTRELESEIKELKSRKLDDRGKERLNKLEAELKYVQKLKEKYVQEHPESRDRVFHTGPQRRQQDEGYEDDDEGGTRQKGGMNQLYNDDGTLKDPKKSYYYDPVYNPFGVPPPGMPYRAISDAEDEDEDEEDDEDEQDEDDSEDGIIMPEGPPPDSKPNTSSDDSDGDSDDSDDIPLPSGPPPPRALPIRPPPQHHFPVRSSHPPFPLQQQQNFRPGFVGGPNSLPPFPPRPFPIGPGRSGSAAGSFPAGGSRPPPFNGGPLAPHLPLHARRGPPGAVQATQDPLSDRPNTTYQAHRAHLPARPPPAGLPAKPISSDPSTSIPTPPSASVSTLEDAPVGATISAAPVLRDLRKEATVFVPRGVKRKAAAAKLAPGAAEGVKVDAAPGSGVIDDEGDRLRQRAEPGLMDKLQGVLVAPNPSGSGGQQAMGKKKEVKESADDDYQAFLKGLGEFG